MPPGWNQIRALLVAAAFSTAELEQLCQSVFGTSLTGITTSADLSEQSDAIVAFATRYGLIRELTDSVLHESARRPAVQNLLLSDDMQGDSQTASIQNQLQTLTVRMDRVLELQMAQAAENADMQRWRNATDQRMRTIEDGLTTSHRTQGIPMQDRAAVVFMALVMVVMLGIVILSVKP